MGAVGLIVIIGKFAFGEFHDLVDQALLFTTSLQSFNVWYLLSSNGSILQNIANALHCDSFFHD